MAGGVLIVCATLVHPALGLALGLALGPRYPALPTFGITPCPLTRFTFGCLLLARGALPWCLLLIPLLWSLVGGSAAFLLQVPQDWVLLFSGVVMVGFMAASARRVRRPAA